MGWRRVVLPLRHTRPGEYVANLPLLPRYWRSSWKAAQVLWFDYGHLQSVRRCQSIDNSGEAIPWYTYPAVEFLKQFDYAGKAIFEYGSGNSTTFWSLRAASVVSVEDREDWVARLRPALPENVSLRYEPDIRRYPDVIHEYTHGFDIIIVDGLGRARTRMKCAKAALQHLNPGGMVILDNSDCLQGTAALLREADLLQIDMSGFAPIAAQTQTTSLFFHRQCRLVPKTGRQPLPGAGANPMDWDSRAPASQQPPGPIVECEDEVFYGVRQDEPAIKRTPVGERHFRVLRYTTRAGSEVGLIDSDTKRVLLVAHKVPRPEREVARLVSMPWDEFREFVRGHPYRYYIPDESPTANHVRIDAQRTSTVPQRFAG
jgi:hypothetical protein